MNWELNVLMNHKKNIANLLKWRKDKKKKGLHKGGENATLSVFLAAEGTIVYHIKRFNTF